MTLAAGTRLGPYEILSAIEAGGMGEVYKARDPRLNRDVPLGARLGEGEQLAIRRERGRKLGAGQRARRRAGPACGYLIATASVSWCSAISVRR